MSISAGGTLGVVVGWSDGSGKSQVPVANASWSSTNAGVATVSGTGLETATVTGVAAGTASIGATDPTSGTVAVPLAVTVTAATGAGAATSLSPMAATISSLESGKLVTLTAWGGDEFGYAYTYALTGAPSGVGIDADNGVLSVASALSVGSYSFGVGVTNRKVPTKVASFGFTLQVVPGISSGTPTASQIRHWTMDPHSGTWGVPTGNDWTAVFNAMKAAILSTQESYAAGPGDNLLRVYIPLRGGVTYQYATNSWLVGPQFVSVYQDTANFPGAKPKLQNVQASFGYDIEVAILQGGGGTYLDFVNCNPAAKTWQSRIADTAIGDTWVTLKTPANASNLRVGRWHQVLSYDQQGGGGPPNSRYYDYVKVTAISGSTVSLDRPLRHVHKSTYWEAYPQDGISFGEARIMPWDCGGAGGVESAGTHTTVRLMQRQTYTDIEFVINPNYPAGGSHGDIGTFVYLQGCVECFVTNCTAPYPVLSMSKNVSVTGTVVANRAEMDKLIETVTWDGCTIRGDGLGDATGVELCLVRNSTCGGSSNIAPRQLRLIGSTFDYTLVPGNAGVNDFIFFTGIPGPIHSWEFINTSFKADPAADQIMPIRDTTIVPLTLGTDASWSANRLVIPTNIPGTVDTPFVFFLGYAEPGSIVYVGGNAPPSFTVWGYVANVTGPGDGSALWLDVTWVAGTKPTTGALYLSRCHEVNIHSDCSIVSGVWGSGSGGFHKQTAPAAFGATYGFPSGYPPQYAP